MEYFKIFGIEKYEMRLGLHDPKGLGKKYINNPKLWKKTEEDVRNALKDAGLKFVESVGDAAFYGPKIDVQVWSAIGKEFSLATNQVDFAVPERFNLTYTDGDGSSKTPLCAIAVQNICNDVLKKEGYNSEWGIGRHYQGSQIFDYWRSPFDQVHEHETDGDVFDNSVPPNIVEVDKDGNPTEPEMGPSQWGPAVTPTFANDKGT